MRTQEAMTVKGFEGLAAALVVKGFAQADELEPEKSNGRPAPRKVRRVRTIEATSPAASPTQKFSVEEALPVTPSQTTAPIVPEPPAKKLIITGKARWWGGKDKEGRKRNYGFISPSQETAHITGGNDVFVHSNRLNAAKALPDGAIVTASVVEVEKGWAVEEIVNIIPPLSKKPKPVFERAVLESFCEKKGFGFVNLDYDRRDAFVHISTMRACNMPATYPGDPVEVIVRTDNEERLYVHEIRPLF